MTQITKYKVRVVNLWVRSTGFRGENRCDEAAEVRFAEVKSGEIKSAEVTGIEVACAEVRGAEVESAGGVWKGILNRGRVGLALGSGNGNGRALLAFVQLMGKNWC